MKEIRIQLTVLAFVAAALSGCGAHYHLRDKDLACIPYTGNEVLVFRSDFGPIDSFVLLGVVRETKILDEAISFVPRRQEYMAISCSTSTTIVAKSPSSDDSTSFSLISVEKLGYDKVRIIIDVLHGISGNGSQKWMDMSTSEWDKLPERSVKVPAGVFNDVVLMDELFISPIEISGKDFVAYFFWSKSVGLVKFKKGDGSTWELIEKRQQR